MARVEHGSNRNPSHLPQRHAWRRAEDETKQTAGAERERKNNLLIADDWFRRNDPFFSNFSERRAERSQHLPEQDSGQMTRLSITI